MLCESKQDGGLGFSDHHHPIRRKTGRARHTYVACIATRPVRLALLET